QADKTRVLFELFAQTPAGAEKISKAEGHVSKGKAVARIPVYIPQSRDEKWNTLAEVDYFFTAKHSASDLLKDESVVKHVKEMASLVLESHVLPAATFDSGKSQARPEKVGALRALAARIAAWKETHRHGKLAVFGHADSEGEEESNHRLSERRARYIHAFLMKDAAAWETLAREEKWDRKTMPDVQAFMEEHNSLSLSAKDFDSIDGKSFTGCGEFNPVETKDGAHGPSGRVVVFLLKSNKNFPIFYPCKQGDHSICQKQAARKGTRRAPSFRCLFYDKLVTETAPLLGDFEVRLRMDAEDSRAKDDELLLVDEDGEKLVAVKVKEMKEEDEDWVRLRFEGVDLRKRYSLVRDHGPDEEGGQDTLWDNLCPEELLAPAVNAKQKSVEIS
ncbi:MAG TPA: OmpA family protein, partial [Fibrobacteria bacterium]|nr:OmpA family protein [Fibrobacteria bacterium]